MKNGDEKQIVHHCMFEVTAAEGGEEEEQKGVMLHWVNGREAGLPLPC